MTVVDSNGRLYVSISVAAKAVGLKSAANISAACAATMVQSYKTAAGLQWAYVDACPGTWPLHPAKAMKPESVPRLLVVRA